MPETAEATTRRAKDEPTGPGGAELVRRIRAGDPGPLEVVDGHIARISGIEPQANALVTADFDTATSTGGGPGRARFRDGPGAQPGLMRGGG